MHQRIAFVQDERGFGREVLDDTQCADLTRRAATFGGTLLLICQKPDGSVGGYRGGQMLTAARDRHRLAPRRFPSLLALAIPATWRPTEDHR